LNRWGPSSIFLKMMVQAALFEKIKTKKILVVGDVVLDHYIWGDATRISPEAPVPVVGVDRDTFVAGAAANVAMNLRSLGSQVELCGLMGNDADGQRLAGLMTQFGVSYDPRFLVNAVPTIVKTRVLVRGQQLCRLDRECKPATYSIEEQGHLQAVVEKVQQADAVIISDYAKGAVTNGLLAEIKAVAQKKGILIAVDPKPKRPLDYEGVDILKPNKPESIEMAGIVWDGHAAYPARGVCHAIYEKFRCKNLVVTLGGDGMLLSHQGNVLKTIPAYGREVFDVSGAGDTSMAALTLALACGESLEQAAHFANTASGVVVGKVGTALATPEEVLNYHPKS